MRDATSFHTLLAHRTEQMISLLSGPTLTMRTMKVHRQRLRWHIQRLYRVRNSIVHTGIVDAGLSALTAHLQDYVREDYVRGTLRSTASTILSGRARGIDVALARAVNNYEATIAVLQKERQVDDRLVLDGALL